jgi:predicted nucleic acid-binding protein
VIAHFDTSALLKLVFREEGQPVAAQLWEDADVVAMSQLGYAEARAAVAAAVRDGRLARGRLPGAIGQLERRWDEIAALDLTAAMARLAGELADQHRLRGADAVHLAAALSAEWDDLVFVTWDHRLAEGAQAAGLVVAPSP